MAKVRKRDIHCPNQTDNKPIANHNDTTPINATKPLIFSGFVMVCCMFVPVCL